MKKLREFLKEYYSYPNRHTMRWQTYNVGDKYGLYIDYCDDKKFIDKNGDVTDNNHVHVLNIDL